MGRNSDTKAPARRLFAAMAAIVGLIPFCVCLFRHTCMCGHLAHGPYSILPFVNDAAWLVLLPMAVVASWRSDMYGKTLLVMALSYLLVTNVQIITGGWVWRLWKIDLVLLSLLASFIIALVGIFRGRQRTDGDQSAQTSPASLRGIPLWPPLTRALATLSGMWEVVLRPVGWTLLIAGLLSIVCAARYGSEGYLPIERKHHGIVKRETSYTDDDVHVALNALSDDLISHSEKMDTWTMAAAWLMFAGGICLSRSASRRGRE